MKSEKSSLSVNRKHRALNSPVDYPKLADDDRKRLLFAMNRIRGAVREIEKLFDQLPYDHMAEHGREKLSEALFVAFNVGHAGSVQESASSFVSQARGSSGGKSSGKKRRAERPWVEHAETLIKEYVAANPNASQDDIATDVGAGWKLENVTAPSHPTLKSHVSKMQKEKTIQRPNR